MESARVPVMSSAAASRSRGCTPNCWSRRRLASFGAEGLPIRVRSDMAAVSFFDVVRETGLLKATVEAVGGPPPERPVGRQQGRDLGVAEIQAAPAAVPEQRGLRRGEKIGAELFVGHQPAYQ